MANINCRWTASGEPEPASQLLYESFRISLTLDRGCIQTITMKALRHCPVLPKFGHTWKSCILDQIPRNQRKLKRTMFLWILLPPAQMILSNHDCSEGWPYWPPSFWTSDAALSVTYWHGMASYLWPLDVVFPCCVEEHLLYRLCRGALQAESSAGCGKIPDE